TLAIALAACGAPPPHGDAAAPTTAAPPASAAPDPELAACRARADAVTALPERPGAPAFDAHRPEFLGRARGEPMVFVREPAATPDAALKPAWVASRRVSER